MPARRIATIDAVVAKTKVVVAGRPLRRGAKAAEEREAGTMEGILAAR